jgi:hypothetical protein
MINKKYYYLQISQSLKIYPLLLYLARLSQLTEIEQAVITINSIAVVLL